MNGPLAAGIAWAILATVPENPKTALAFTFGACLFTLWGLAIYTSDRLKKK